MSFVQCVCAALHSTASPTVFLCSQRTALCSGTLGFWAQTPGAFSLWCLPHASFFPPTSPFVPVCAVLGARLLPDFSLHDLHMSWLVLQAKFLCKIDALNTDSVSTAARERRSEHAADRRQGCRSGLPVHRMQSMRWSRCTVSIPTRLGASRSSAASLAHRRRAGRCCKCLCKLSLRVPAACELAIDPASATAAAARRLPQARPPASQAFSLKWLCYICSHPGVLVCASGALRCVRKLLVWCAGARAAGGGGQASAAHHAAPAA